MTFLPKCPRSADRQAGRRFERSCLRTRLGGKSLAADRRRPSARCADCPPNEASGQTAAAGQCFELGVLADIANARAAQLVAAAEMNWFLPYGNPASKYGWIGSDRVRTNHEPSAYCVRSRNCT